MEEKVVLLGLDGVPFELVSDLASRGYLPNLRRVLEEGASGILRSTIPPLSPIAWSSIMTGLNPGKHGVFGFVDRYMRPLSSRKIRGRAIWDLVSLARGKAICLNVPLTYPPYPLNGIIVSGAPCPKDKVVSSPPEVANELKEQFSYRLDIRLLSEEYQGLKEEDFLEQAKEVMELRAEALLYLAEKSKWDILCAVFTTMDRIQHVFFGRAFEDSPFFEPRARDILIHYYSLLDALIGKLMSEFLSEAIIVFSSDHGFEPLYKYVGLQNILEAFLTRKRSLRVFYTLLMRLIDKLGLIDPAKRLLRKSRIAGGARRALGGGFECGMGFIYISNPSFRKALDELVRYLQTVIDPEEGRRIIKKVYRREELYHGPFLKDAPDLLLVPELGYELRVIMPGGLKRVRPVMGMTFKTGTHMSSMARRGFFAIIGDGIAEGLRIEADVYDIVPTVLHILGLPIPSDVDGKVLMDVFKEGSELAKRPIKKVSLRARRIALRAHDIKRRLKRLGSTGGRNNEHR